jgi:hypothetical protein
MRLRRTADESLCLASGFYAQLSMASISETWGTTSEERSIAFPCDGLITDPDAAVYRGVTILAQPEIVFRWLCQLRVAPYSYDWIDNCGRQSPRVLTPGLDQLAIGQDVMGIFDLVDFAGNQHLTIRIKPQTRAYNLFGVIAGSYLILPEKGKSSRLVVKLIVHYPRDGKGKFMRQFLPWGDLIMMRRQLLNLKQLAEETE